MKQWNYICITVTITISEAITISEISLRKKKWLVSCWYNPHKSLISSHLNYLNNILDKYSKCYENLVFIGDFNITIDDKFLDFCELNDLSCLIDEPTFSESIHKSTCIDLILTKKPSYFQHSNVFESSFSDFHSLTVREFKIEFQKLRPQVRPYHLTFYIHLISFRWILKSVGLIKMI